MNALILEFQEKMNGQLRKGQQLTYLPRDRSLQIIAIDELRALKAEAGNLKADAIQVSNEEAANILLSFENVIETLIAELQMWISLKDDTPHAAWNYLIDAQNAAIHAARAHSTGEHMANYARRLEAIEHLIFPPQVFTSPGMLIRDTECSICGKRYGECEHVKGKAYMGEFCQRIIKDFRITEASVVDEPADKRCIVLGFWRDGKTYINRMTLRPTDPGEDEAVEADGDKDSK